MARDISHDMITVEPLAIAALSTSAGSGALNLRTFDPKEVWQSGVTGTTSIDVDLGAVRSLDTVLLGYTNAADAAVWSITGGSTSYTATQMLAATMLPAQSDIGDRRHGFVRLAAPQAVRFLRLSVTQPPGEPLQAGVLVVGMAWAPEWPNELGPSRGVLDTGDRERLPSGGFGVSDGAIKALWRWSYGDLSDAERRQLWGIVRRLGTRRPVLIVEDPAATVALGDGIHYGLFDPTESYERIAGGKSRWTLAMEEWV